MYVNNNSFSEIYSKEFFGSNNYLIQLWNHFSKFICEFIKNIVLAIIFALNSSLPSLF